jgi:FkbM family methyltransferase
MFVDLLQKYENKISGFIQVGAHVGQQVESFLRIKNKNIYLFEPNSQALEKLKEYENEARIKIFDFGLGNDNTTHQFFTSSNKEGVSSSVLRPRLHEKYFPEVKFQQKESIQIKKFSSLEKINGNFLVIDVQGYELEVLKGFEDKINNIDFIFSEISMVKFYENNTLVTDLDKFLNEKNFLRIKTSFISNVPMGDAFYISKKFLSKSEIFFYKIKSRFQITLLYRFFNIFKDKKKLVFHLKNKIKKYLISPKI